MEWSRPRIVGEQVNPIGNKTIADAIKRVDMPKIRSANQVQMGAHIIDVNIGVPGIDEVDSSRIVKRIRGH